MAQISLMPRCSCLTLSKQTRLVMSGSPKEQLNKIKPRQKVLRIFFYNILMKLSLNILNLGMKMIQRVCFKYLDSVSNITELHKVKITTLIQLTTLKELMSSSLKDTSVFNFLITKSTRKIQPHLSMDRLSDKWSLL